jgi:hypothetical protein
MKYNCSDVRALVNNVLSILPEYGIIRFTKNNEKRFEAFWNQIKEKENVICYRNEDQIVIKSKSHVVTSFII